ncbi:hypothetical protein [Oceanicola sp. 502str15]|uniref:hypothetical protein n=1 Tax=Oceanicola sp. 502str15 TaxID=2696061 RepID=UPI0020957776|nr:hypothetical protein [Oceanicola sp. 502str15]MCO6384593.1 hypothetical protein [Oceanicola sp. 502str15]
MIGFSDWPQRQALHDLRAAALAARPAVEARGPEALRAVPLEDDLQLACDTDYLPRYDVLHEVALGADAELAGYAMALLVGDAVHGQIGTQPGLLPYRSQPGARRAALVRGLHVVDARHDLDSALPELVTSLPTERVIPPLVEVARRLRGNVEAVANADYGMEATRHGAALRAVLDSEGCRMSGEQRWYPAEVVELTGHDPDSGDIWLPCIALLVLDDIHHNGAHDQTTFRWMHHAARLLDAPEPLRGPILAGIRHVMERCAPGEWDPYFEWLPKEIGQSAVMVPWVDVA